MPGRPDRKRQSLLAFSPLPTSSPIRASQPASTRDRAAFVTIDSPSPTKRRKVKHDLEHDQPPTPKASEPAIDSPGHAPTSSRGAFMKTGHHTAATNGKRQRSRTQKVILPDQTDSDSDQSSHSSLRPSKTATRQLFTAHSPPASSQRAKGSLSPVDIAKVSRTVDLISDDDMPVLNPGRRTRSSVVKAADKTDDEDEDDDNVRKTRNFTNARPPVTAPDLLTSDSAESDEPVGRNNNVQLSSSESEDEAPISRRRKTQASSPVRTPKAINRLQDRDEKRKGDLQEDLEFLGDADVTSSLQRRDPASEKRQSRLSALQALKARRSKQLPTILDSDDHIGRVSGYSTTKPSEDEEPEESEGQAEVDSFNDDDFIVEDDQDAESHVALPFEFSNYATMKPKNLFKFVIEWMVQKKINPAFPMDDEVYVIAFKRLDDFLKGMGGSKFHSSAWTAAFGKSLRSRPQLNDLYTGASLDNDRCDACNRSGHPASYEVQFIGKTYNKNTLEEDEEDEEDEADSDVEEEGDVPAPTTKYRIGKHCMQNARIAHAFTHWKFHLNEWVVDYLKNESELTSSKIIARDGWNTNKRRKDAERIVDEMEGNGEIQSLYRDFRSEINTAQMSNRYDES